MPRPAGVVSKMLHIGQVDVTDALARVVLGEDATSAGLVEVIRNGLGLKQHEVRLTRAGREVLAAARP